MTAQPAVRSGHEGRAAFQREVHVSPSWHLQAARALRKLETAASSGHPPDPFAAPSDWRSPPSRRPSVRDAPPAPTNARHRRSCHRGSRCRASVAATGARRTSCRRPMVRRNCALGEQPAQASDFVAVGVDARTLLAHCDGHRIGDHQGSVALILRQTGQQVLQERIARGGDQIGRVRYVPHRLPPPISCNSSYSSS